MHAFTAPRTFREPRLNKEKQNLKLASHLGSIDEMSEDTSNITTYYINHAFAAHFCHWFVFISDDLMP